MTDWQLQYMHSDLKRTRLNDSKAHKTVFVWNGTGLGIQTGLLQQISKSLCLEHLRIHSTFMYEKSEKKNDQGNVIPRHVPKQNEF